MRHFAIPPRGMRRTASGTALLICLQLSLTMAAGGQQAEAAPQTPAPQTPAAVELPDVVARVNGEDITDRELLARAQTMRNRAVQAGAGAPQQSRQFLLMVLDAMINERLVYADSRSRGVAPSEADVDQRVQEVIASFQGEEGFEKALAAEGLSRELVRRRVSQELSFDHMMNTEIKPGIEIGEDAVAAYYEQNKERMKVPMLYKVRRIMKRVPGDAGDEALQAARAQLEAVRQQAVGGTDFAALAQEHSEDQGTRDQGGELPWFPLTDKGDRFETLIAGLEVGQVSEIVEAGIGPNIALFLLKAEGRQPERIKTLEEARGEIVNVLAATEARRVIQGRIQRLRTDAEIEILM